MPSVVAALAVSIHRKARFLISNNSISSNTVFPVTAAATLSVFTISLATTLDRGVYLFDIQEDVCLTLSDLAITATAESATADTPLFNLGSGTLSCT